MIDKLAAIICFLTLSLSMLVEAGSFFHANAPLALGDGSPNAAANPDPRSAEQPRAP